MSDMDVSTWAAVGSGITAAVSMLIAAGSFLVAWRAWRRDEMAVKRDVLSRLVGNAYRLTPKWKGQEGEPFIALNEAFVVYADHQEVIASLVRLRNELGQDGRPGANIVTLVKAMADASKVPVKSLDEEFITSPFVPGKPSNAGGDDE